MEELRVTRRKGAATCTFCHDDVKSFEPSWDCPGCQALYHADCLAEELSGHCATPGCEHEAPRSRLRRGGGLRARLRRRRRRRLLSGRSQSSVPRIRFSILGGGVAVLLTGGLLEWPLFMGLGVVFVLIGIISLLAKPVPGD